MKTIKKILTTVLTGLLIVIITTAIFVRMYGDRFIKVGIEVGATKALKVGVRLDDVNLSILGGKFDLNNLIVDNPAGYQNPTLLTLGHAHAALNIKSLMSDTVEIEKVQLDNVSLTMEQKGLTNNLQEILKNLPKSDAPVQTDAEGKPAKNLKIKELQINGVAVKVKLLPIPGRADTVTLKLSPITLTNLGNNEKMDVAQLTSVILKAIAGGIMEQGKDLLPTDMLNDLGKDVLGAGQKVLEEGAEAGKGIIEGVGDIGKGAGEAIKGIFKKKE